MLLGKDLETNETRAVAMQQRGKHASTTIELLLETVLCNPLLGRCKKLDCNNGNGGAFYAVPTEDLSWIRSGRPS
jgi:hypothetical protein